MKKLLLLPIVASLLIGCGDSPEEVRISRQTDAAVNAPQLQNPTVIGTLSTGQTVSVAALRYTDDKGYRYKHYLYLVSGAPSQTMNWSEQSGKTTIPRVNATLTLSPQATPEDIMKLAEQLHAEQDERDRAEWTRLNQKFGGKQ